MPPTGQWCSICGMSRQRIENDRKDFEVERKQGLDFYIHHNFAEVNQSNRNGICLTGFPKLPLILLHEFDGDNILRNGCG